LAKIQWRNANVILLAVEYTPLLCSC